MPTMSPPPVARLPYVPEDPALRATFERLRQRWPGAPVLHLYRLLGWAPGLVGPWQKFAQALRFRVAAPAALRELMVVRSGQLLGADYEWQHHWVAALDAGITEGQLQALPTWRDSPLFDARERAVLALADDTALGTGASEQTVNTLWSLFPTQEVAELIVIAGFYAGVGRIVNSFGVPLEPGFESMLPREA